MRRALVIGSQSAIAGATVDRLALEGWTFTLVARNRGKLEHQAAGLQARGVAVRTVCEDFTSDGVSAVIERLCVEDQPDLVILAFGVLGDARLAAHDAHERQRVLALNFTIPADMCLRVANYLEARGRGDLVVIGSVAGDRGRQSNYIYGAAKAGLGVLVQGLAHRLARSGKARAILIKPGLVITPMTEGFDRSGLLWSAPQTVARAIVMAVRRGGVVNYAPGFWRWIMLVIRALPARLMHRTAL